MVLNSCFLTKQVQKCRFKIYIKLKKIKFQPILLFIDIWILCVLERLTQAKEQDINSKQSYSSSTIR